MEHCADCGVCVVDLDHHCVFFDGCIGQANIGLFAGVLIGLFVCLIFVFATLVVAQNKAASEYYTQRTSLELPNFS